jgi:hypothetical protein
MTTTISDLIQSLCHRSRRTRGRRAARVRPWAEDLEGRELLAAPYYGYALDLGGTSQTWGHGVAVDGSGDAVVTGHFLGTANFDPRNPANTTATLTTPSYYDSSGTLYYASNAFVARYDPNGNLLWVRQIGNASGGSGERVAIDQQDGDIYAAGSFSGTVTVGDNALGNPVTLTASAESGGDSNYVVMYTPGGTVAWAQALAGTNVFALATDAQGNVFVPGSFGGSTATIGGRSLSSTNGRQYLAKLGPDGTFAWVDQFAASIKGLAVDGAGNPYLTGGFTGTVDFDPGPGKYTLYSGGRSVQPSGAAYVEKLNASGGFVWADAFQASQWSLSDGRAIAIDAAGNVYSTGIFGGTVDFDPGKNKYTLTSGSIYVSKLTSGGQFVWAEGIGGANSYNDTATGIAIDPTNNNVDLTGYFGGTVDFDPGPGTYNLSSSPGGYNIYVAQLTGAGGFVWAVSAGSTSPNDGDESLGVAVDPAGEVFTTGFFAGTVNFDPNGTQDLTAQSQNGQQDGFLWKLKPTP